MKSRGFCDRLICESIYAVYYELYGSETVQRDHSPLGPVQQGETEFLVEIREEMVALWNEEEDAVMLLSDML